MSLEHSGQSRVETSFSDDAVGEMLALAARLKKSSGGQLDDDAILAVSEATGAPADYVRLALRSVPEETRPSLLQQAKNFMLSLDPNVRRFVATGYVAFGTGLSTQLAKAFGDSHSLFGIVSLLLIAAGVYHAARAKDVQSAALTGAFTGGLFFISSSLFHMVLSIFRTMPVHGSAVLLIPYTLGAAGVAMLAHLVFRGFRKSRGQDISQDRQELLRQLVALQDKLRVNEQSMTFLSTDIVGSTKMKQHSDPLAIEFTFTEYHRYVETIVRKHGGRVHSTAGDGLTCAFDEPAQAFAAARQIQGSLFEFNDHGNRLSEPIRLRIGLHTGNVVAPGPDIQSVSFAHVIDIAAHLQKACPVGCVAVSEFTAAHIPGGPAVVGDERVEAQEVSALVWRPKSMLSRASGGADDSPPPPPSV